MKKRLLSVAAIIISSQLIAQDSVRTKQLDEVVITATKYPVKLSETGKVVTVITNEQIGRSQGKDLAQLLSEQTSIIINGATSNPGKDKSIFIRGASNDYTLILLDGIPVSDPTGVGGAFDLRLLPLNQIERIEILKGSQSTLYGSDAVAGVINIITKKNSKKKIGFTGGLTYGTFNTFNGNAGVNGHTGLIDYSAGYSYGSTGGISEATDTTGVANFDKDGFHRQNFQANISFNAGRHVKIMPFYRYTYHNGNYDADAFTDGANHFTSLFNNTGAVVNVTLPRGTITANYGYTYAKRNYASSFSAYGFKGRFQNGEVYLTHTLTKEIKFLAGVNYQQYQLLDTSLTDKNPHTSIVSPYASFFIQNETGLSLEVGGRYNNHSKFGSNFTYSFNAAYKVYDGIKLFVNISSGFKAPTVTELFGAFGANPALKPEKSNSLEGGIQWQTLQKKLLLTVTGFNRDIKDVISYVGSGYINIDQQHDNGVEADLTYNPTDRITVKASYTYVTGNVEQKRNGKDTSFYNLIRRPKHTVMCTVGYQATKNLYLSAGIQSLSKRTDLFFQSFPPYGQLLVDLKAYALLNAYAEYKFLSGKLRIFADAKNITDTKYMEVYGYSTTGFNINGGINIQL